MPAPGSQAEAMVLAEFARRTGLIPAAAYGGAEAAAAAARDLERERARVLAVAAEKAQEAKESGQEWKTYLVDDIANFKSVQGNSKQVDLQEGNRIPESRGRRANGGHGNDAGYVNLSGGDITDSSWPLGELLRRPDMRGKPQTHELYVLNKAASHLNDVELAIADFLKRWRAQRERDNLSVPRPSASEGEMEGVVVEVPLHQLLCWFNTLRGAAGNLIERHSTVETLAKSIAQHATALEKQAAAEMLADESVDRQAEGLKSVSRSAFADRRVAARMKATREAVDKERAKRLNQSVKDAIPQAGGGRGKQ